MANMCGRIGLALCLVMVLLFPRNVEAQTDEAIQLGLNIAKYQELLKILDNMRDGYKILTKGYKTIKDISEGNFNMHDLFLDKLWDVSPTVAKYQKIPEIISMELRVVKESKISFNSSLSSLLFSSGEISYLDQVYKKVGKESLELLDDLLMIVTARKLRMNDEERMKGIDNIHVQMGNVLDFLRHFNTDNQSLMIQRVKEKTDLELLKRQGALPNP